MHKNTMKTPSRQFKCSFWHKQNCEITNGISMLNTHSPTVGHQCLPNNRKMSVQGSSLTILFFVLKYKTNPVVLKDYNRIFVR